MRLDEYVKSLKSKRVTVVGAGISNRPLIKLLCASGVDVTVCDRSETLHEELQGLPIHTTLGEHYLDALDADIIFRMTAEKIRQATQNAENYSEALPIHVMEDFRETVLAAAAEAEEGDVVLLSPASTSFDKFANFEERGNTFRRIVEAL